jgi:hypothetical protein
MIYNSMKSFKNWLQNENLSGPGGGPDPNSDDLESLAKEISSKGSGAFKKYGDAPCKKPKTAASNYADPRFPKYMKKP